MRGTSRHAVVKTALAYGLGRTGNELPEAATPTLAGLLRAGIFHYGRIVLNGNGATHAIAAALAATPAERVLDFGCGCGGLCLIVPGEYVGIDLDPNYIAFARWRWRHLRRRFLLTRLEDLPEDEPFHSAILSSALHHLSDEAADGIFARLARIVSSRVVVLDLDPEAANRWQRFLIDIDRGEHVRTAGDQRTLLERHFVVTDQRRVVTTTGSTVHSLFVCTPLR